MLTDGFPGIIVSDDDFGINSAGLMVTETTITGFSLFDPNGKPEFMRARKALQYASSIDEYVEIMLDGNNGGYANDWLLADNKTGEIARFEIGLKLHRVWRTNDGYFEGSNFPSDPALIKAETDFDPTNMSSSPNARQKRWQEILPAEQGPDRCRSGREVSRRPLRHLRGQGRSQSIAGCAATVIVLRRANQCGANRRTTPVARLPRRPPTAPWRAT